MRWTLTGRESEEVFDAGEGEALRPCLAEFRALRSLPSLVKGPVDFCAFALLATNFSTLIFIGLLNALFKLGDFKRHFFKQLRRKSDLLVGLHQQTHILQLAFD